MRRLYRHFLRSFFVSDALAEGGDPRALGIAIAAIFAAPGLAICFYLSMFDAHVYPDPMLAYFVALSLLLAGLLGLVQWEALLPSRLDFAVFGPMPISRGAIGVAKLLALAALLGGFTAIFNGYSSVLFPLFTAPDGTGGFVILRRIAAQMVATAAASVWAFAAVVAMRSCLPDRGALARGLRLGLTVALLCALVLSLDITAPTLYRHLAAVRPWWIRPLLWFVGFDQWLSGTAGAAAAAEGRAAFEALAVVAPLALAGFALRSRRVAQAPLRPEIASAGGRFAGRWLLHLAPQPRERAVYRFTRATLVRSRSHGVIAAAWMALGAAAALAWVAAALGARDTPAALLTAVLAAPLALGFCLIAGLRHIFAIPVDVRSNWLFRLAEADPAPERYRAARTILWVYAVFPALALAAALAVWAGGWELAVLHVALCAVCLGLLAEGAQLRFVKLPFTCPYVAGRANLKLWWWAYVLAFSGFAYGTAVVELRDLDHPARFALLLAGCAAGAALVYALNRRRQQAAPGARFDDAPEPAVQTLSGNLETP